MENKINSRDEQWRADLRKSMLPKERTAIDRTVMPELDLDKRLQCSDEVNLGFTVEMAMHEAQRCLDCPNPGCVKGCPVGNDIPGFIKNIERGNFEEANRVLKRTNSLSAMCGRVCPQENQCEGNCIHLKMKRPAVSIGNLERFVADWHRTQGDQSVPEVAPANGKKVAAVGSGPAGLSFAGDMAKLGYDVTVYEALHEIGGVPRYGIPEFCLPNAIIDYEVDQLRKLGVKFQTNVLVGKTISYDDLKQEGYDGIFVGAGAGFPRFMNIPGENLTGVMTSNEYLTRINLMGADGDGDTTVLHGETVAVIGGGNTAIDASRVALRHGAKRVLQVYRRSEEEMPARLEEVRHAREEGVEFWMLHNPVEYLGNEQGRLTSMRVQRMELGEPDESGRRSPVPVKDDIVTVPVDLVIVAVGVSSNPTFANTVKGLDMTRWNTIVINEETQQSSVPDVYAGGDVTRGGATVVVAIGDGRKAARNMHKQLSGE